MRIFYITGTGKGIGKALAEALLPHEDVKVYGISRSNVISHPRFVHIKMDLANLEEVVHFHFEAWPDAKQVVLVNNAGTLGDIGPAGTLDSRETIRAMQINLVAPMVLTNMFFRSYCPHPASALVINISSGAGKYPVDGWSTYCASKAGIDMFSRVVAEEMTARDRGEHCKIFSIAPGIVDTAMQDHIRNQQEKDFPRVSEFREYKTTGKLAAPSEVAQRLVKVMEKPEDYPEVLYRLF